MPEPTPAGGPLLRGEVVLSFAFDVANEIATGRVRSLLSRVPSRHALRTDRTAPKSIPLYRPLEIEAGHAATLGGRPVRTTVRVYDVGVVAVTLRVPFEAPEPTALRAFHTPVLDDGRTAEAVAADVCAAARLDLAAVMTRPGPASEPEAYTAFCLSDLGGERDATRWLADHARSEAGLLAATDSERLSHSRADQFLQPPRL